MKMALFLGLAALAAPAAAQHSGHAAPPAAAAAAERPAHASGEDQRAVLAVVDRLFAALGTRSRDALLAEVVPEGRATASRMTPTRAIRSVSWPEFADGLSRGTERLAERLIDPHVHIEGDIAMIWSRYEFEIDGRFSHCGIDHFDLVRIDGRWKVLNLTWTQQMQGCPGR
jgi:hypothetical protein